MFTTHDVRTERSVTTQSRVPLAVLVCCSLWLGGRTASAAFSVTQTGNTLNVTGPIVSSGDSVHVLGAGPGTVDVWDSGAFAGTFAAVADINLKLGGANNVHVRLLAVKVKGAVTIITGAGSDGVLLVSNEIGGTTTIMTGAGEDLLDVQHNTFYGDLDAGTSKGGDLVALYDNVVHGDAALETGAGHDEVYVGYDHAHPVTPANTIHGELTIATADGDDLVEVSRSTVGGNSLVDLGAGGCDVTIEQNWLRAALSVATGDAWDSVYVLANRIDADVTISTGPGPQPKYVFVTDENRIRGNLSVSVADCLFSVVHVFTNEIGRGTAITLGSSMLLSFIGIEGNSFHGLVALAAACEAEIELEWNSIHGDLGVNTGDGADLVTLQENICDSDVTIDVGNGDDDVELGDPWNNPGLYPNTFNANVTVDGAAGFDELFDEPLNVYAIPPLSQNFESIFP